MAGSDTDKRTLRHLLGVSEVDIYRKLQGKSIWVLPKNRATPIRPLFRFQTETSDAVGNDTAPGSHPV